MNIEMTAAAPDKVRMVAAAAFMEQHRNQIHKMRATMEAELGRPLSANNWWAAVQTYGEIVVARIAAEQRLVVQDFLITTALRELLGSRNTGATFAPYAGRC